MEDLRMTLPSMRMTTAATVPQTKPFPSASGLLVVSHSTLQGLATQQVLSKHRCEELQEQLYQATQRSTRDVQHLQRQLNGAKAAACRNFGAAHREHDNSQQLASAVEATQQQVVAVAVVVQNMVQANSSLQGSLGAATSQLAERSRQLAEMQVQYAGKSAEEADLRAAHAKLQQIYSQLQHTCGKLNKLHAAAEHSAKSGAQQVTQLTSDLEAASTKQIQLQKTCDRLQQMLTSEGAARREGQQQLAAAQKELAAAEANTNGLQQELTAAQQQLHDANERCARLAADKRQLEEAAVLATDEVVAQLAQLRQELAAAEGRATLAEDKASAAEALAEQRASQVEAPETSAAEAAAQQAAQLQAAQQETCLALEQAAVNAAETATVQHELQLKVTELAATRQQLAAAQQELGVLRQQGALAAGSQQLLEQQKAEAAEHLQSVEEHHQAQLKQLEKERQGLHQKLRAAKDQFQELAAACSGWGAPQDGATADAAGANSQQGDQAQELKELKGKVTHLEKEVVKVSGYLSKKCQVEKELRCQLKNLQRNHEAAFWNLEQERSKVANLEQKVDWLQQQDQGAAPLPATAGWQPAAPEQTEWLNQQCHQGHASLSGPPPGWGWVQGGNQRAAAGMV